MFYMLRSASVYLILGMLLLNFAYGQSTIETRVFNGIQYHKLGSNWQLFDQSSNTFRLVAHDLISIKLPKNASESQIGLLENNHNLSLESFLETGWADFSVTLNGDLLDKCDSIMGYGFVLDVELSVEGTSLLQANDSCLTTSPPSQWSIDVAKVDEAWDYTTGDTSVILAVIDHGINWWHTEFRQASNTTEPFWQNSGEDAWADPDIPGGNGIDDDSNGFVDDWMGWNFIANTNDVRDADGILLQPHGTSVAAIATARSNNAIGIAGVAGGWGNQVGAKTMIIKMRDVGASQTQMGAKLDDAILYACKNGANVINISMGFDSNFGSINDAIEIANRKYNTVIVAGSGNDDTDTIVYYPARNPLVLGVALTDITDKTTQCTRGKDLDLSAPGHNIPIINTNGFYAAGGNYYSNTGTSFAAPMVAGTACLMLSQNPCMSSYEVADIIRHRSDKVNAWSTGNINGYKYGQNAMKPGHNKFIGYGRLNAKKAVQAANAYKSDSLDLYIKDHYSDFGFPNSYPSSARFDDWSDIWVRNQPDGHQVHFMDTVVYKSNQTNYVYVRVRNKSCVSSSAQDSLAVYWSKLSLTNSWPQNWDGTNPNLGNIIGKISLPVIAAGADTIIELPWNIDPEPVQQWGTCILARISSPQDSITPYPNQLNDEIRLNNNIAARNLMVVKGSGKTKVQYAGENFTYGVHFLAGNESEGNSSFDINFDVPESYGAPSLAEDAEIKLFLGDDLWSSFLNSDLSMHQGIDVWADGVLLVLEKEAKLVGLSLPANTRDSIFFAFNYLAENIDSTIFYRYHITQVQDESISGSVNFNIERSLRSQFRADAGSDKYIKIGDSVLVHAQSIGETAEYTWLNSANEIIHIGQSFMASPEETTTYTLQVQAEVDLYKDYDKVTVNVIPYRINSLSPNPATNLCTIGYLAEGATNASLLVVNSSSGASVINSSIDPSITSADIVTSNLSTGSYVVILICDGQIADSANLQIQ